EVIISDGTRVNYATSSIAAYNQKRLRIKRATANGHHQQSLVRVSLRNRISQSETFLGDHVTTLHAKTESSCYCFAR
ncbi:MAG TPA: hypothetical protein VKI62_10145, partial [Bacteroidota bacterium]|nr:hypothetical protein [Bacteroidota bacterium]